MRKWWNAVPNASKISYANKNFVLKFAFFPKSAAILLLIIQFDLIRSLDDNSRRISRQANNWRWPNQGNLIDQDMVGEIPVTQNFLPTPRGKIENYRSHFANWPGTGGQMEIVPSSLSETFWARRYSNSRSRQRHRGLNYRGLTLNRSYIDGSRRAAKRKRVRWRGLLGSMEEESREEGASNEYGTTGEELNGVYGGDCSLYPNNTFNAPFAYACETREEAAGVTPPALVVHEAAFANETGDYVYPLDFAQTLRVFLDVTNYATRRYDNMRAEVLLYRRKTGWMGCGWSVVPTFGTLDSLEICEENNPSCPVYPGRQVLEMKMEPSPVVSGILRMFYDDRVPYQMRVRVMNNRRRGEELFCVVFQARIEV